jgi:hypothetical protein
MGGKTVDEAKEAQRRDKEAKKKKGGGNMMSTSPGKYPVNVKGADGKVYMAYMDSPPPETLAFTAIVDAEPLPMVPEDTIEYAGWITLNNELKTSVD